MTQIKNAPVVFFGLLQTALIAVLVVLQAFNVFNPTATQQTALLGAWGALSAIFLFVIWGLVTPVAKLPTDKGA